ncbi:MAG: T9SS type A sorting domain-containing protein [Flavobacterium sp.]|uniref:T9SS type A sorting domain-containing protein n=1 Tax=Flavobacterium sp. TaxID=239 RepID=UPI0032653649
MKTKISLLLTVLSFVYTQAQAPAIQWQKPLGGTNNEGAAAIQKTPDGGYVTAGSNTSNNGDVTGNHGGYDYWIVKLDAIGNIQWQKSLGGSGDDVADAIQTTADGGYIVTGYSNSNDGDVSGNHGNQDCWVVKLDTTGNIQWQKSFGSSNGDAAFSIQLTSDGGYVMVGYSSQNDGNVTGNHGGPDYWVVKLDAGGNMLWQKSLGGSADDVGQSVQTTSDGGYIVAGYSSSNNGNVTGNHGTTDYWVVKLDASGNIQWQKSLGGSNTDYAQAIQTTSDGGYIVVGSSFSNNGNVTGNHGGISDFWVVKLNATGTLLWQKSLGGSDADYAQSIQTTSDGGCVVAGYSYSNDGDIIGNHGSSDCWIIKLDITGTKQWQKPLGGSGEESANSIQNTSDGGYVITGFTNSNDGDITGNHGGLDCWVVKLAPDALATPAYEKLDMVIFPNPVCNALQIQTPANKTITAAKIIAINGQVILETQNSTTINVENLAKGIYILEAYSGEEKYTNKFVKE